MEPVVLPDDGFPPPPPKPWALTGCKGRPPNTIRSLFLVEAELEEHNRRLQELYRRVERSESKWEGHHLDDAEIVLVAYGICARIAREAVVLGRQRGMKIGLLRPITLWPFPRAPFEGLAESAKAFLVVEMSMGQMVEDVRLAVGGRRPVALLPHAAVVPGAGEILERANQVLREET